MTCPPISVIGMIINGSEKLLCVFKRFSQWDAIDLFTFFSFVSLSSSFLHFHSTVCLFFFLWWNLPHLGGQVVGLFDAWAQFLVVLIFLKQSYCNVLDYFLARNPSRFSDFSPKESVVFCWWISTWAPVEDWKRKMLSSSSFNGRISSLFSITNSVSWHCQQLKWNSQINKFFCQSKL